MGSLREVREGRLVTRLMRPRRSTEGEDVVDGFLLGQLQKKLQKMLTTHHIPASSRRAVCFENGHGYATPKTPDQPSSENFPADVWGLFENFSFLLQTPDGNKENESFKTSEQEKNTSDPAMLTDFHGSLQSHKNAPSLDELRNHSLLHQACTKQAKLS
mmetsp:Transcript_99437/g.145423  ORF Transcript_99437/g.145423 Transcript_99437/m.145423 type:complete len:159 (+) Transcript_99437:2-478(+)